MTVTQLPDGRTLKWTEWGPADGRPVAFCPGGSDPDPDRTLLDWPEDVGGLGLEDPAVVGYSQGAPFALACAAAGIASRAAVVAGTDELSHPAFAGTHDAHLRAMLDAGPAAVEESLVTMTAER